MKNLILIFATMFATFSFAQFEQGTWTFGAGDSFISTAAWDGYTADASYFVMDGLMVSLSLDGSTEAGSSDDWYYQEGNMNWGLGARYYVMDDGLWVGAAINNVKYYDLDSDGLFQYDNDGNDLMETGMDMRLQVGCSKVLGMDGKLWFEPMFSIYMPAGPVDLPMHYGLGAMFRFAF